MQAVFIASKRKHTDYNHQDINCTQKCNINTSLKITKLEDPMGMKMPNFRPLCQIVLLWQEFKEKPTSLHETA
jgi:hypothetical protein